MVDLGDWSAGVEFYVFCNGYGSGWHYCTLNCSGFGSMISSSKSWFYVMSGDETGDADADRGGLVSIF